MDSKRKRKTGQAKKPRSYKIRLETVKYLDHPKGSVLEVGKDIPESHVDYLLICNAATVLDKTGSDIKIDKKKPDDINITGSKKE